MNKCFTALTCLILLTSYTLASNAEIKGRILNEKKEPAEFASVALLKEKDSTLAFANITDSAGSYTFTAVPEGTYLLAINAPGTTREYYGPILIDSTVSR